MGVAEDFAAFRANYLIPNDVTESISYRYKRITRQLNTDFRSTTSDTANSLYIGSYGRDTAARGVSDLDIGYVLPASLYAKYDAYQTNGQSALLQEVKKSIRNTYPTSDSFGDGQVVVITFQDGITFEVLPVFENTKGTWTYPNANDGGSWRECDPRAEINAVATRNNATNGNLKCLCRMMRIWKNYCSVPISGMLIDTLAYQFIENYPYRTKSFLYHDFLARDFFDFLSKQDQNQNWWRAPGSGSWVQRKGTFEHKARSAYLRACEAIQYNDDGHQWSRRQKWREVFGPLYPD